MKKILALLFVIALAVSLAGCDDQASNVSYNLSKEADNFNVIREVTVVHGITGEIMFQMSGRLSIEHNSGKLEVIAEYEKGMYAKHFFFLGDNGQAVVEQLRPAGVNEYSYTLNLNPKLLEPFNVKVVD